MSISKARIALQDLVNIRYEDDEDKCDLLIEAIKLIKDDQVIKDIFNSCYNKLDSIDGNDLFDVIISSSKNQDINIKKQGIDIYQIVIAPDGYCGDHVVSKAAKDQGLSDELKELGISRKDGPNAMRILLCKLVSNLSEEDRVMFLNGLTLEKYIEIKRTIDVSSISAADSHLTDVEMELLAINIGINLVFLRWELGSKQWVARARITDRNKKVTFVIANINRDGEQDHFDVGYLKDGDKWNHSNLKYGLNIINVNPNSRFQDTLGREFRRSITNLFDIAKIDFSTSSTSSNKIDSGKKERSDSKFKLAINKARRGKPPDNARKLLDQTIIKEIQNPSGRIHDAAERSRRVSLDPISLAKELETPVKEGTKSDTYANLSKVLYGRGYDDKEDLEEDDHDNLNDTFDLSKKGKSSLVPNKSSDESANDKMKSLFGLDMDDDPDEPGDSGDDNSSDNSSSDSLPRDNKAKGNRRKSKSRDNSKFLKMIIMKLMDKFSVNQSNSQTLVVGHTFDAGKLKLMIKQEIGSDGRIQPLSLYQLADAFERFFLYRKQETNRTHKDVPVSAIFSEGVIQSTMAFFSGKIFHGKIFPGTVSEFYSAFPVSKDGECIEAVVRAYFPENPTYALKEFWKINVWEDKEKETVNSGPLVDQFLKKVSINIRLLGRFLKLVELINTYDKEGTVLPRLYSENRLVPSIVGALWAIAQQEGLYSMKAAFTGDQSHLQEHIKTMSTFRQYYNVTVEKLAALQDVFKIVQNQLRFEFRELSYQEKIGTKLDEEKNKLNLRQMSMSELTTNMNPDEEDENEAYYFSQQGDPTYGFSSYQDNDYPERRNESGRTLVKADVKSQKLNSTKPCLQYMERGCKEPCPGGYSHNIELIIEFLSRLLKKWSDIKASTSTSSKLSSIVSEVLESTDIDQETKSHIFAAVQEKLGDRDVADAEFGLSASGRQG